MSDRKPHYNTVQNLVRRILKENYVISPPVNIVEIAQNYGLGVFDADFDGMNEVAGYIDPKAKKIIVNRDEPAVRKAFTVAHELGHWLLHQDELIQNPDEYAILYRNPLGQPQDDPIEKEANFFAAHLLVPSDLLDEFYRKRNYDLASIAEIFGVSQEVIGYRLKNEYGLSPAA